MEDLVDVIALGHVGVDLVDSDDGGDQPVVAAAVVEELPQELQLVFALAQQPEKRHASRSWQLMEQMRSIKKEKVLERKLVVAAAAQKRSDALIRTVASEFPVVARCLGLPVTSNVMDDHRASILMRMSYLPALRGEIQLRMTQFRAVSITARAAKMQAEACRDRMFGVSDLVVQANDVMEMTVQNRVHVCNWAWDETSQRIRGLSGPNGMPGERTSHAQVSVQIMMQCGQMSVYQYDKNGGGIVEQQPWFARGLLLKAQTANALLEGLLREHPVNFESVQVMHDFGGKCEFFVATFTVDRASANFCMLGWIFHKLMGASMPANLLLFVEPCAAHGLALIKNRPTENKVFIASTHSFSALMRQWRVSQALRDQIVELVKLHLKIERTPCSDAVVDRNHRLVTALYGPEDANFLQRVGRDGTKTKSRLASDLDAIRAICDMDAKSGPEGLVHHCFVCEGSAEHLRGRPLGSACCSSRSESVDKVAVALVNFLLHRPWDRSSENRWTYVLNTLRKLAVGYACKQVLPHALRMLKATWKVDASMERQLELLLDADQNNFHAKSQLRLLRVCRSFCEPSTPWRIAVEIVSLTQVDRVLYEVLGDGVKERASLATLLDEETSVLASSQQSLLSLLERWGEDVDSWELFGCLAGDYDDASSMLSARNHVLQLMASLQDHFVLRMKHPPYTLFKLADKNLDQSSKQKVAEDLFARPEHCLSQFCLRLREMCPSPAAVLAHGPHVVTALSSGTPIAIDFLERSHGKMRTDLRSTGRARNATASCNRIFCQQIAAEHHRRTGVAPHLPPLHIRKGDGVVDGIESDELRPKKKPRLGGNPRLEWQNSRMSAYKKVHAPNRPLSSHERAPFLIKRRDDWNDITHEEKDAWTLLWRAEASKRGQNQLETQALLDNRPFCGLWSGGPDQGGDRLRPVPCCNFIAVHQSISWSEQRRLGRHDPSLVVEVEVPDRLAGVPSDMARKIFGCFASKKNVCREAMPRNKSMALSAITGRLSSWVDSFGAAACRKCDRLLLLRGRAARPDLEDAQCQLVVMLIDARFSPKMQFFGVCRLKGSIGDFSLSLSALPCVVSLATETSAISKKFRTLMLMTSDELGMSMLGRDMDEWGIAPLKWEMVVGAGSLMDMRVTEIGENFTAAPRIPRIVNAASNVMDVLDMHDDPVAFGERMGAQQGQSSAASGGNTAAAGDELHVEAEGFLDFAADAHAEALEGLPRDLMFDIMEETGDREPGGDDLLAEEPPFDEEISHDGDVGFERALDEQDVQQIDAFSFCAASDGGEMPSVAEAVQKALTTPLGYVSCELGPWLAKPMLGRLTSWPESQPQQSRSVSMKCYLHPNCTSPAVKRWKIISDDVFYMWLFNSKIPDPGATTVTKKALGAEHKAAWATVFSSMNSATLVPVPAASSSGAASSSHEGPAAPL